MQVSNDIIKDVENYNVLNALLKARQVIPRYLKVAVSISGGSDSDIMLDIVEKVKGNTEVVYFFIDTGLEYQATKDHLDYLEERYNIKIDRVKAKMTIPTAVKKYGVPFISKHVSECVAHFQRHGFSFLTEIADKGGPAYINWWENTGSYHTYRIDRNKYLKEFMMSCPPDYPISMMCCEKSKKATSHEYERNLGADLTCLGIRRAEGGIRATAYKSCWDEDHPSGIDKFRPIFWLTDEDKKYYEERFNILHSRCYTEWGFKRTGCVGCPFNKNILNDLDIIRQYEPKMYKACMNIFGKSYEYTKKYRSFQAEMKAREKAGDQLMLTELVERME